MSKSVIRVVIFGGSKSGEVNVLAQATESISSLQVGTDAAMTSAGEGAVLQRALELLGKPIDGEVPAPIAPAEPAGPKAILQVTFRLGSGPSGTTPSPMLLVGVGQTNPNVSSINRTIEYAGQLVSAVPNEILLLGNVDLEG
jgi:hypothetical protein